MSEDRIGYGERARERTAIKPRKAEAASVGAERIACADCGDVGQPGQAQPAQIGTPRGYICAACHQKAQAALPGGDCRHDGALHEWNPAFCPGRMAAAAVRWDSDRLALAQQLSTLRALLADARLLSLGADAPSALAEPGSLVRRARRLARLGQEMAAAREMFAQLAASVPR